MPLRRWLLLAWLVGFTALTFYGLGESHDRAAENRALAVENRTRIHDIQDARLSSCRQTYEGIREVFKPFFPANPNPAQRKDLYTFNTTINGLKANCVNQTKVKE